MSRSLMSLLLLFGFVASPVAGQAPASSTSVDPSAFEQTVARGIAYLRVKGVAENGSYSSYSGIGVTALCTTALLRSGVPAMHCWLSPSASLTPLTDPRLTS